MRQQLQTALQAIPDPDNVAHGSSYVPPSVTDDDLNLLPWSECIRFLEACRKKFGDFYDPSDKTRLDYVVHQAGLYRQIQEKEKLLADSQVAAQKLLDDREAALVRREALVKSAEEL